jgi:hypothetical protein
MNPQFVPQVPQQAAAATEWIAGSGPLLSGLAFSQSFQAFETLLLFAVSWH